MKRVVPYGFRFGAHGVVQTFPMARGVLKTRNGRTLSVIFLIDSGATITVLPSGDAAGLDIGLRRGAPIFIQGVSGEMIRGYRHELSLAVEGFALSRVPVVFIERPNAPRVLGREGVFEHFIIIFDEARRRTGWFDGKERRTIDGLLH